LDQYKVGQWGRLYSLDLLGITIFKPIVLARSLIVKDFFLLNALHCVERRLEFTVDGIPVGARVNPVVSSLAWEISNGEQQEQSHASFHTYQKQQALPLSVA
jgi:hypothetical protein